MDAVDKFKKDVEYRIEKHGQRLGLSDAVVISAKNLYGMYHSDEKAFARTDDMYALASIYLAHKTRGEPTSIHSLCTGTDVVQKHVVRTFKAMKKDLSNKISIEIAEAEDYIDSYCEQLGLHQDTCDRAKEIMRDTEEVMENKAESTKAAASIYLAAQLEDDKLTQRRLAQVSGVTEVTIRHRYKEQKESLGMAA